ncbi:hypothetical protein RCO48_17655 [Peribacillus frigoritolerans]|nr:hypothetical protein [Peribacillus frigoritolerans]
MNKYWPAIWLSLKKIKQLMFTKNETAKQIHEDFYQYLMKEYTSGINYMEKNIYRKGPAPLYRSV